MSIKEPQNSLEALASNAAKQSVTLSTRLSRCWQIATHYRWSRIIRRGINTLPTKLTPNRRIGILPDHDCTLRANSKIQRLAETTARYAANHPSHQRCDLASGTFELLNRSAVLGTPENWNPDQLNHQPHLWRFQLHYHEFLFCWAESKNWSDIELFLSQWLKRYAPQRTLKRDDAWHSYCISRRVVVWVGLLYLSQNNDDGSSVLLTEDFRRTLLKSIVAQTEFLSRHLERDLGGNHLLENAAALAIASSAIDCPLSPVWKSIATDLFKAELPGQILAHGEHFELAPMYHCQMLGALLKVQTCCQNSEPLYELIDRRVPSMLDFLLAITHPDYEIPLFADSGFHESPSVQEIIELAELNGYDRSEIPNAIFRRVGDYQIFKSADTFVIADFGPVAAPGLPAHGHCDALTLEASIGGNRWIVDSGNYNYQDDSMRHYCRSSISHNVATIDNENQAVVWSKFRMGHRPKITDRGTGKTNRWNWTSASHDGYRTKGISAIERILASEFDSIICVDHARFSRSQPTATMVSGFLHFHPKVSVEAIDRGLTFQSGVSEFAISRNDDSRKLVVFSSDVSTETGWYCESFGRRQTTQSLRYYSPIQHKVIGWILIGSETDYEIRQSTDRILIKIAGHSNFQWRFNERV